MPRLFVALDPPGPVREALGALERDLPGARWTPPERLHLTLFFIGEVDDERARAVEGALAGVPGPPAPVRIGGLGAFPSRRAARVLVATVEPHPALEALHFRIAHALGPLDTEAERRPSPGRTLPFRPHLTLARLRGADRRAVRAFLAEPVPALAFEAAAFHLYRSARTPAGPRYHRLRSFPLGGDEGNSGIPGALTA